MLSKRHNVVILHGLPRMSSQPARPFKNCSLGGIARPNLIFVPKISTRPNPREIEKIMSQSTNAVGKDIVQNPKNPKKIKTISRSKSSKMPTILRGGAKKSIEENLRVKGKQPEGQKVPKKRMRLEKTENKDEQKSEDPKMDEKNVREKVKQKLEEKGKNDELEEKQDNESNERNETESESESEEEEDLINEEETESTSPESESDPENTDKEEKALASALLHPLKVQILFKKMILLFVFYRCRRPNFGNSYKTDGKTL